MPSVGYKLWPKKHYMNMKTRISLLLLISSGIIAAQNTKHMKPVPVILTGELFRINTAQ